MFFLKGWLPRRKLSIHFLATDRVVNSVAAVTIDSRALKFISSAWHSGNETQNEPDRLNGIINSNMRVCQQSWKCIITKRFLKSPDALLSVFQSHLSVCISHRKPVAFSLHWRPRRTLYHASWREFSLAMFPTWWCIQGVSCLNNQSLHPYVNE